MRVDVTKLAVLGGHLLPGVLPKAETSFLRKVPSWPGEMGSRKDSLSRWEAVSPSQWDVPSQYGSPANALRSGSPIRNFAESDAMASLPEMSMSGVSVASSKPIRRDHRGEKHSQRSGDARFPASKPRRVSTLCTPSNPAAPPSLSWRQTRPPHA